MKAITLDKLRTLAVAVADAEQGSKAWDKATDALSAKFSPRCLVTLIDQLEAAQRARDESSERLALVREQRDSELKRNTELEAELKHRDDAVPVAWILHARGGDQLTQDGGYVANAEGISGIGSTPLYAAAPAAVLPTERDSVRTEHAEWSMATFGNVGPVGPLKHLSKEALEAAAKPCDLS